MRAGSVFGDFRNVLEVQACSRRPMRAGSVLGFRNVLVVQQCDGTPVRAGSIYVRPRSVGYVHQNVRMTRLCQPGSCFQDFLDRRCAVNRVLHF